MKKIAKRNSSPQEPFLPVGSDKASRAENSEATDEFYTIDGQIISQVAIKNALQNGKGLMIGGFFVGATLSADMLISYQANI